MMQFSNISIQGYSYEGEALGQKRGKGYYKAHSYYSVDIDDLDSALEITLGYAHDQSRGSERNYTLTTSTQSLGVSPGTEDVTALLDVYRVPLLP